MAKKFVAAILVLVTLLLQSGTSLASEQQNAKPRLYDHCEHALAYITDEYQFYKTLYFKQPPKEAISRVDSPQSQVIETIVVAPVTGDEYKNLYFQKEERDNPLTPVQAAEVAEVKEKLNGTFGLESGDRTINSKNYRDRIKQSKASFVILIGHNDMQHFHFLDGSAIPLDLLLSSVRPEQSLILISCESTKVIDPHKWANIAGVNSDLTYPQAFDLAQKLSKSIGTSPTKVSLADVRQQVQKENAVQQIKYLVGYLLVKLACFGGPGIGAALVISAIDPCKDESKKNSANCKAAPEIRPSEK